MTKNAYEHAELIAREKNIYIFPSEIFLSEFKKDSEEFIKHFDEEAHKAVEKQQQEQ